MALPGLSFLTGGGDPPAAQPEAVRLLTELQRTRAGLSVYARELGGRHASLVLDVRADEGCLFIDELSSARGAAAVQPGLGLDVESNLDGIAISFDCRVLAIESDAKGGYYRVTLPPVVERKQRRQHHRVSAGARKLTARLRRSDGPLVAGELVDISAGGVSVRVAADQAGAVSAPRSDLDCQIQVSKEETLALQMHVCRIVEQPGGRSVVVAGRLANLTPPSRRRIGKLVADLEREHARKRPRGD